MMSFFHKIKSSIYDPEFYSGLSEKPFSFSFKYFFSLASIIAVIMAIYMAIYIVPAALPLLQGLADGVLESYPEELIINIKGGVASVNVSEPYFIPAPASLSRDKNYPKNILAISTRNSITIDGLAKAFEEYQTIAILTKNSIIARQSNGETRLIALKAVPEMEISKESIASFIKKIQPFFKLAAPILAILILIGFFFWAVILKMAYLVFAALLILLIVKLRKYQAGYKKAYQIGLHAITLPMIFSALSILIFPRASLTYIFTAILLIVAALNLKPARH